MDHLEIYTLVSNYQNICRTCMLEINELKSVFITSNLHQKTYAHMLTACTSLKITETDELSLKICSMCINRIDQYYTFLQACNKTDFILKLSLQFFKTLPNNREIIDTNSINNELKLTSDHEYTIDDDKQQHVEKCKIDDDNSIVVDGEIDNNIKCNESINVDIINELTNIDIINELNDSSTDATNLNDVNDVDSLSSDIFIEIEQNVCQTPKKGIRADRLKKNHNIEIFSCDICMKNWISEAHLKKHLEIHTKCLYKCDICGSTYNNKQNHTYIHRDHQEYLCGVCNRKFFMRLQYDRHKLTHSTKSKYICDKCGLIVSSRTKLDKHLAIHSDTHKKCVCEICGSKISTHNYNRHMHIHNTIKPHNCEKCGRGFTQKPQLTRHKLICNSETIKLDDTETPKPFKCIHCTKTYKSYLGFKLHLRNIHQNEQKQTQIDKDKAKDKDDDTTEYKCTECERTFPRRYLLDRHMHAHTIKLETSCKLCKLDFQTYNEYIEHRKTHPTAPRLFQCQQCGKVLAQATALDDHMRVHTGARPFKCSFCDKHFRQRAHKYSHERLHTGMKPYTCVHCNKSFRHQTTLVEHNQRHLGDMPYKCFICNRRFYRSYHLKKHLRRHD